VARNRDSVHAYLSRRQDPCGVANASRNPCSFASLRGHGEHVSLEKKRILVIDDDHSVVTILSSILALEGYSVDTAGTGKEAIEKTNSNRYDLALVDFRLPDVEGTRLLTAMREMTPRMVKVILTGYPSADNISDAVDRHADGFIVKPVKIFELLKTIKDLLIRRDGSVGLETGAELVKPIEAVVAIGASAGGPKAIEEVLSKIPSRVRAAFVISQHMPNGFTKAFAQRLAMVSNLRVKEAEHGDVLREGDAYVTPGGYDMEVTYGGRIRLQKSLQAPTPSIDRMMKSTADVYGPRTVGVLLTGMLTDGVLGMKAIKDKGGITIVQDEASSVVYGMPKAALAAGAAQFISDLSEIPNHITNALAKISNGRNRS